MKRRSSFAEGGVAGFGGGISCGRNGLVQYRRTTGDYGSGNVAVPRVVENEDHRQRVAKPAFAGATELAASFIK